MRLSGPLDIQSILAEVRRLTPEVSDTTDVYYLTPPFAKVRVRHITIDGRKVSIGSPAILALAHCGAHCAACGAEVQCLYVEQDKQATTFHFAAWTSPMPTKKQRITLDHKIPRSLGGSDLFANVQPMCYRCNNLKGARHEFPVTSM